MSVEVQFEADMDDILGVDSQKQGAHNFRNYQQASGANELDYGDVDDIDRIISEISIHINNQIDSMKDELEKDAATGGGGGGGDTKTRHNTSYRSNTGPPDPDPDDEPLTELRGNKEVSIRGVL